MSSRHIRGRMVHKSTGLITTGNLTMTNESAVVVNKTSGAATTVTLPGSPVHGTRVTIVDGKGDALTNNITVTPASGNVNGLANHILCQNWGKAEYVYDAQSATPEWKVLHGFISNDLLWRNCPYFVNPDPKLFSYFHEDFLNPASATASDYHTYTSAGDGATGTNAFQDAAGGVFNLVTAAADNDYHELTSVAENWLFEAGKKLWFECRVKLAEATTNESAWWAGFSDTLTTGGFQANAAGPLASYDGALIWKTPETALTLNFETSNAGTQATSSADATSVSNTWTRVGFYFDGTATTSVIQPYYAVNGAAAYTAGTPQNITLAGLEEMHLVLGVKSGPTAAAETLQISHITVVQIK